MKIAYHIARLLAAFIFGVLGWNGFVPFIPAPPTIPPTAMAFFGAMSSSHYGYMVFGVQIIAGILLLINRYVVLALVALAGVIMNILTFHITMWPSALVPMPIVVTICWFVMFWALRRYFAPIFVKRVEIQ